MGFWGSTSTSRARPWLQIPGLVGQGRSDGLVHSCPSPEPSPPPCREPEGEGHPPVSWEPS